MRLQPALLRLEIGPDQQGVVDAAGRHRIPFCTVTSSTWKAGEWIVAHGLWELSWRRDQLAAVRADPETNVPIVREEMIRYCAPAQWFARTARKPFTIGGQTIEPGQRVITLLASASRDEREYAQPNEFIWNRPNRRSLAFVRGSTSASATTWRGWKSMCWCGNDCGGSATSKSTATPLPGCRPAFSGDGTTSRWWSDVWAGQPRAGIPPWSR